jgi:hypothetical protein
MYMLDLNGEPFTDTQGNKREIGWYTSVVIGPEVIMTSDKLGTYYGSPAIAMVLLMQTFLLSLLLHLRSSLV